MTYGHLPWASQSQPLPHNKPIDGARREVQNSFEDMLKTISVVYAALACFAAQVAAQGTPKWMKPPATQSNVFGTALGKQLGEGGSATLSTKGSEVMSPVPLPSTLFGLHATDQTSAESPFAGPTQFAYGAPHEMRMKDPYPVPHQPTVSSP